MSVLRAVRKRKKVRKLGRVKIIRREAYADLELDAKMELIRSLVPLGLMHVQELLDPEVTALASERYARKAASVGGRRHGSNPRGWCSRLMDTLNRAALAGGTLPERLFTSLSLMTTRRSSHIGSSTDSDVTVGSSWNGLLATQQFASS